MAVTCAIEVMEEVDASGFKLYDLGSYSAPVFTSASVTAIKIEVEYDGVTYTYDKVDAALKTEMGMGVTYINLCGPALNSYFLVTPDHLLNGATPLNSTYFPDGYYEITLTMTYDGTIYSDYSHQGFLAENYMMASKLPLTIDMNDFDYEENRLQFLCIALLRAATWAAELGRQTEFEEITEKVGDFLDARGISEIWST